MAGLRCVHKPTDLSASITFEAPECIDRTKEVGYNNNTNNNNTNNNNKPFNAQNFLKDIYKVLYRTIK